MPQRLHHALEFGAHLHGALHELVGGVAHAPIALLHHRVRLAPGVCQVVHRVLLSRLAPLLHLLGHDGGLVLGHRDDLLHPRRHTPGEPLSRRGARTGTRIAFACSHVASIQAQGGRAGPLRRDHASLATGRIPCNERGSGGTTQFGANGRLMAPQRESASPSANPAGRQELVSITPNLRLNFSVWRP